VSKEGKEVFFQAASIQSFGETRRKGWPLYLEKEESSVPYAERTRYQGISASSSAGEKKNFEKKHHIPSTTARSGEGLSAINQKDTNSKEEKAASGPPGVSEGREDMCSKSPGLTPKEGGGQGHPPANILRTAP